MTEPKLRADATSQKDLYDLLKRNGDTHFQDIYRTLGGPPGKIDERDTKGRWYAQSWVSTYIRKLNRHLRLVGQEIVPGRLRQTYVLTSTRD